MGFLRILKKPIGSGRDVGEGLESIVNEEIDFDILKSVDPFLKVFKALEEKMYYETDCQVDGGECHLSIRGNRLFVNDKLLLDNLIDFNVFLNLDTRSVILGSSVINSTVEECQMIYKSIMVSNFETITIQKNLTGVLISKFGIKLNDIHLLLNSKNKFNYKDWCYIKLIGNENSEEFIKCWCHIDRDNSSSNDSVKIKFYQDDNKTVKKNNLIGFIDNVNVTDLFLNVSNPDTNCDTPSSYIKSIDSIKLLGSFKVVSPDPKQISRSSTSNSLNPDNTDNNNSDDSSNNKSPKVHRRNLSIVSAITQSSYNSYNSGVSISNLSMESSLQTEKINKKKINLHLMDHQNGLIIKPIPHKGISYMDSLLRMLIPMFDCLKKYGRPEKFNINKNDKSSIMFALPEPKSTTIIDLPQQIKFIKEYSLQSNEGLKTSNQISMDTLSEYLISTLS